MFGRLARRVPGRGNFKSVQDMADAIDAFMEVHDEDRMPYRRKNLKVKGALLQDGPANFAIRH
jgi:hypothetical protein